MLRLPFFAELDKAQRILLAGAGGGYDVFCGLLKEGAALLNISVPTACNSAS